MLYTPSESESQKGKRKFPWKFEIFSLISFAGSLIIRIRISHSLSLGVNGL